MSETDLFPSVHSLDQQENAELTAGQQSRDSNNADGTGFFSLAVLENVSLCDRFMSVWVYSTDRSIPWFGTGSASV